MFSQLRKRLNTRRFDRATRGIFGTPRVECDPGSGLLILTQLHHPDVTMYMLAAKSFAQHIRPAGFVIVDDGLTADDRQLLTKHFENLRFIDSSNVALGACPSGGCWERLMSIVAENHRAYVIQLDADTLTIAPPDEVLRCVREGRSFTMGTPTGRKTVSLDEATRQSEEVPSDHVQSVAERALARYPAAAGLRYVRGCAGFAGFARGSLTADATETFSTRMEALIGRTKWHQWGSEQVTSNFLIANMPASQVLPVERYPFWAPGRSLADSALVHFFGKFRFTAGMYQAQARRLIEELRG
jgi:hypothetical protein